MQPFRFIPGIQVAHVESMEIGLPAIEQTLRLAYCEALPKHYPRVLAVLRAVGDA